MRVAFPCLSGLKPVYVMAQHISEFPQSSFIVLRNLPMGSPCAIASIGPNSMALENEGIIVDAVMTACCVRGRREFKRLLLGRVEGCSDSDGLPCCTVHYQRMAVSCGDFPECRCRCARPSRPGDSLSELRRKHDQADWGCTLIYGESCMSRNAAVSRR